ncbi:hypothetical protein KEM55_001198 [Ascosphaera atra]|nr:hypothetical protein KEM55_001198 [Ascosphaera atra]
MSPVALSDVVAHHSPVQPSSDWETVDGNSTFAAPTSRPRGNTEGDSNQPHDIPSSPARDKHSHARAQSEEGAEVDIVSPLPFQKHNDPFRVGNELDGATLVERTRRSMSLVPMPAQPPAPEPDQDTVDNSRLAVPTTPFETPRKPRSRSPLASSNENMFGATTPREELFNREADYDSVFKSRPKIAMSPVRQPLAFMPEQSIEDMLADDYDGPSMIAESTMNESPLVKKFR